MLTVVFSWLCKLIGVFSVLSIFASQTTAGMGISAGVAVGAFGLSFFADMLCTLRDIHKATNRNSEAIELLLSKVRSTKPNGS